MKNENEIVRKHAIIINSIKENIMFNSRKNSNYIMHKFKIYCMFFSNRRWIKKSELEAKRNSATSISIVKNIRSKTSHIIEIISIL